MTSPLLSDCRLLERAYSAFNARDIDGALATMRPDVDWPNAMDGGRVHGHEAVREYWMRQWRLIDPHVEPVGFELDPAGRTIVRVHQVVRDLGGAVLRDQLVEHVYAIEGGLITSMDVRSAG